MVFVSKNDNYFRKCKWCDNQAKKNIRPDGRNKGYYRTCGSDKCLKSQYQSRLVCAAKGNARNLPDYTCRCCENIFTPTAPPHKKYCLECAPDEKWRGRCRRYGIGKKGWLKILAKQNGLCALCDRIPEVVDHCHNSHVVRGLLCNYCNTHIARMDNDTEWLKKVLNYIGV